MKKYTLVAIYLTLCIFFVPRVTKAVALPFGGRVTVEYTCNNGLLLYVVTSTGILPLMWNYGNLVYLMHVIPHPGQNMIGWYSTISSTCTLGPYTIGVGFPIIFHGESI